MKTQWICCLFSTALFLSCASAFGHDHDHQKPPGHKKMTPPAAAPKAAHKNKDVPAKKSAKATPPAKGKAQNDPKRKTAAKSQPQLAKKTPPAAKPVEKAKKPAPPKPSTPPPNENDDFDFDNF